MLISRGRSDDRSASTHGREFDKPSSSEFFFPSPDGSQYRRMLFQNSLDPSVQIACSTKPSSTTQSYCTIAQNECCADGGNNNGSGLHVPSRVLCCPVRSGLN